MCRRVLAPVAAALLAAAAVAVPADPAEAAGCSTATGVTVVVDFSGQGGAVETSCDPAGASKSAAALLDAAFGLTYAQRQPGFICRVRGIPAEDPCVTTSPADAYWGLFGSDGRTGTWTYSSLGAGGLKVPDGGYVGLAWQDGGALDAPGLAPSARAAAPSPTAAPKPEPEKRPTRKPKPAAEPRPTPPPSAEPRPTAGSRSADGATPSPSGATDAPATTPTVPPSGRDQGRRSRTAAPAPNGDPTQTSAPGAVPSPGAAEQPQAEQTSSAQQSGADRAAEDPGGRVPTWLSLLLLTALPLGAGALWWRRRGAPAP